MSTSLRIPGPEARNPFGGKGLAVTVALLLRAPAPTRLVDLAADAAASPTLVSRVVRSLRSDGLIAGHVTQGREGAVVATTALFSETALHWPPPLVSLQGGTVPAHLPRGGGAAWEATFGVSTMAPSCVYVRRRDDIEGLLALTGGALVSEPVAEWQVAVVDFPFDAGSLPPVALALELGRTPRGREQLGPLMPDLLADWPAAP